jgi:hypothetical protein
MPILAFSILGGGGNAMHMLKLGLGIAALFLGVQVGRDLAHKYLVPVPTS